MANYRTAGLITGLGRGLNTVSERMFQRERDLADEYKTKRLARFSHGLSEESAEKQRTFAAGEAEKGRTFAAGEADVGREFTAEQVDIGRTQAAGLINKTLSTFDDKGEPIAITVDAQGNEIRRDSRPLTAAEATVQAAKLKGVNTKSDIKAAVWSQTKDELFSDEFAEYAAGVAKEGGMDINSFWAQFMDPETGFKQDAALAHMKANNPGAHDRYRAKRLLMDQGLEAGLSQSAAIENAHQEYVGEKAAAGKAAKVKSEAQVYKDAGVTKTVADAWAELPQNDATVTSWSQEMMDAGKSKASAEKFAKKIMILKNKNPWLFQQLQAERQRNKEMSGRTAPAGLLNSSTSVAEPTTVQKETGLLRANIGR